MVFCVYETSIYGNPVGTCRFYTATWRTGPLLIQEWSLFSFTWNTRHGTSSDAISFHASRPTEVYIVVTLRERSSTARAALDNAQSIADARYNRIVLALAVVSHRVEFQYSLI